MDAHPALAAGSAGMTLWISVLVEVALLSLLGLLLTVRDSRRARGAEPGTLLFRGGAVSLDTLAQLSATSDPSHHRGPLRRPVHTHSGTIVLTPGKLSWRPDAYSRRHGGRGVGIPLENVEYAETGPRLLGSCSLLILGFEDGTEVRFVARGGVRGVRAALQRAGLLADEDALEAAN